MGRCALRSELSAELVMQESGGHRQVIGRSLAAVAQAPEFRNGSCLGIVAFEFSRDYTVPG